MAYSVEQLTLFEPCCLVRGGQCPRYAVWENVPGAFSSNKGHDFRAVLEEICQAEVPMPAGDKWAEAGLAELPRGEVAWRTLDARFTDKAVPQRRKRIFLVADFRGNSAAEILFEPSSVLRDIKTSENKKERTTNDTEKSFRNTSCCNLTELTQGMAQGYRVYDGSKMAIALTSNGGGMGVKTGLYLINNFVRRLTPLECERLQGLPDGYTNVDFKGKAPSDSARYKALGNGMAQPCADFVIRRIAQALRGEPIE